MNSKIRMSMVALAISFLTVGTSAMADGGGLTLEVTITNLTSGQVLSPPVVVSHRADFELYTPGEAASSELAMLAEDAIADPLLAALDSDPAVLTFATGSDVIPPGESASVMLKTNAAHRWITVAGMLVTTNDAFYAVSGLELSGPTAGAAAKAWDAGSEMNNEDCDYIPGPPCENPGVRTATSEGFVHIHNGVHGGVDLAPSLFDWRNPVAMISVRRVGGPR